MSNQHIGRRVSVGLGLEGTPGTPVAPQIWLRWLAQDLQNRTEVIENESAMGVVDQVNDSEVTARWAEGTVGGKVSDTGIGFLLSGFFGLPTTGAAVNGIYPHTFSMKQSTIPQSLTVAVNDPVSPQRHSYGTVDTLEITAEAGGWVEFSTAIKARKGTVGAFTPAFVDEVEFASKHISVKLADSVANLAGASNLKGSRVSLSLERPSTAFNPLGTSDDPEFDRGSFGGVTGELVIRYTENQYQDDFLANAIKAMQVALVNGDKSLTFSMAQVRYRELEKSTDKDEVVTQSISFKAEYSLSAGKSVEAVLKNGRATYGVA